MAIVIVINYIWLFNRILGFDEQYTQKACCGVGGTYNYNPSNKCGHSPEVTACDDPDIRIIWDGIHLTQAGYMNMVKRLLATTITAQLQCSAFVSG